MAHFDFHNNYSSMSELFYESHKSVIEKVCLHLNVEPSNIDEIVEKFIGKPHKIKSLRDPLKPLRPKSAYIYFCKDKRPEIKKASPEAKLPDIAKILGKLWSECSEEERALYIKESTEDKQRYLDEMETYKQNRIY